MAAPDLEYVNFRDFSAGIRQRLENQGSANSPAWQPGVATIENTYRCIALRGGGLGPLPRRTYSTGVTNFEASTPDLSGAYYVVGFYVAGTMNPATGSVRPHEFHICTEYRVTDGTARRRFKWERLPVFSPGAPLELLKSMDMADDTVDQYVSASFVTTRSNRTNENNPGVPVVAMAWYETTGGGQNFFGTFPDETNPSVTGTWTSSHGISAAPIVGHQGRIIMFQTSDYGHGAIGAWNTNENLWWSKVNNLGTLVQVAESLPASVFSWENPDGYTAMASMSAGELFLVKRGQGALTVNGDLNSPTVINLPNVPGGRFPVNPCHTPLGVLYAGVDGMYIWSGGDTATNVSSHLEPDVFETTDGAPILGFGQSWCYDGAWAWGPENWLFDPQSQGWWRYEDPSLLTIRHARHHGGRFTYGNIAEYTNATNSEVIYGWDKALPALTYSWQSQPLWVSLDRHINVRQLILTAHGSGTITITLTGLGGATTSRQFTVSSNYPTTQRANVSLYGHAIKVRIEADGGAQPAPIVYQLQVGYDTRMRVAAT